MDRTGRIEIWFFIGALLFAYGVLIIAAGVYYLFNVPVRQIALSELHPDLWWGAMLLILGLVYCIRYWPFKKASAG